MPKVKDKSGPAAKKPRAPKNAHQLATPLPTGEVLTDFTKKGFWKLGKPIGSGGFGLIYLTQPEDGGAVSADAQYVMKIEPHSNGPLFCELHCYQRLAKADMVKSWMSTKQLKSLGMPLFIASGMHERSGSRYRFMVMQRFGTDLQKLFEENNKRFPPLTVFTLAVQLLDVLEYVHEHDYVHADIKASNLLLDASGHQVYLVDFGLAFRYCFGGEHKSYSEDPKRCHDGTIEFTSRDAHKGVTPSRRADFEILAYCLLQWLCQRLPWEDKLDDKEYVRDQKIKYMKDIPSLLKKCFPAGDAPDVLRKFLQYVNTMQYETKPDYNNCRQMFKKAIKALGYPEAGRLDFTSATPKSKVTIGKKRGASGQDSPDASPPKIAKLGSNKKTLKASPATPKASASTGRGSKLSTPRQKKSSASSAKSPMSPGRRKTPVKPLPNVRYPPTPSGKSPVNGKAKKTTVKRLRRTAADMVSHATQTSPGLKGLRRSRRK